MNEKDPESERIYVPSSFKARKLFRKQGDTVGLQSGMSISAT